MQVGEISRLVTRQLALASRSYCRSLCRVRGSPVNTPGRSSSFSATSSRIRFIAWPQPQDATRLAGAAPFRALAFHRGRRGDHGASSCRRWQAGNQGCHGRRDPCGIASRCPKTIPPYTASGCAAGAAFEKASRRAHAASIAAIRGQREMSTLNRRALSTCGTR